MSKVFESLAQSLREAGQIERGEIKPSHKLFTNAQPKIDLKSILQSALILMMKSY
jgi:hypothetical protein